LSLGWQSLAEGGPLVSEKIYEIIVKLWMPWMSMPAKKTENTPKNAKKATT